MEKSIITLKYLTYYKNLKNFNYLFPKFKNSNILFLTLPTRNKYFTIMKSPKCYKNSKLIVKYSYKLFFYRILKKIKYINFYNIMAYLNLIKKYYLLQQINSIKIFEIKIKIGIFYTFNSF